MNICLSVLKNMGDRMVDANGVFRMVKYGVSRSGLKYVVGQRGMDELME